MHPRLHVPRTADGTTGLEQLFGSLGWWYARFKLLHDSKLVEHVLTVGVSARG